MSTIVTRAGKGSPLTNAELDANFTNLNAGKAGLRRLNVNGDCAIAQNGASFAGLGGGTVWTLDGYAWEATIDAVVTVTQAADAPADNEFQFSHRVTVTTADAAIAAGQYAMIDFPIEGYDVRQLIGRAFTISFWVRSPKTGVHCVSLRNSGFDRNYVLEYTVNAANTWEKKSVSVPAGLITAGTWNWTSGTGLRPAFILACGTTYHGAPNAWGSVTILATANQVNCLDTVGNIFGVTGVQVAPGDVAEAFDHTPFHEELHRCRRYFERGLLAIIGNAISAGGYVGSLLTFLAAKRAAPTMTIEYVTENVNTTGVTISPATATGARMYTSGAATGNLYYTADYVASARLS